MAHHWTPLETVQRVGPTEWYVFDGHLKIAVIRALEIGPDRERVLRAVTWAPESDDRVLLGYFPHLRMAAWCIWQEYARARRKRPAPDPEGPSAGR